MKPLSHGFRLLAFLLFFALMVPRATWALPVVSPSYLVSEYASATLPVNLAFGSVGELYTGAGGRTAQYDRINRIAPGGGLSGFFGVDPIYDPDAVAFDALGVISGTPGSVIVGGSNDIYSIRPDQSVVHFASLVGETNHLIFDNANRLLISQSGAVYVSAGGAPTQFIGALVDNPVSIAVNGLNRLYVGLANGDIMLYESDGTLVELFAQIGPELSLALNEGGLLGDDLFGLDNTGSLYKINAQGVANVIGTGFGFGMLAFGPDGGLYASDMDNNKIYRISVAAVPEPATFALMGLGLVGLVAMRRRVVS